MELAWEPPGPISARFMVCDEPVQILNGPVGSGKTVTALVKCTRLAALQTPSRIHQARNSRNELVPVRQFRVCVVRDTYRQLWRSTIPSWFTRVPKEVGKWTGAENAPSKHRINFELRDGTLVDFEIDFVAIGDDSAEQILRGYEPTIFYLNELDMLPFEVYVYAVGRTGRFPPVSDCGSRFHGIIADCNAPILDSQVYNAFFKPSPLRLAEQGIALFRQPGGRSPGAENLKNLVPDYYERQARIHATRAWYIARMIDNKAGYSRDGQPVYASEYNDAMHVSATPLAYVPGIALQIGLDAGLNPAAIFTQHMPNGQWFILDELIGETGTGPTRFGKDLARRLQERYPLARTIVGWADPSSQYGADKKAGEANWMQIVAKEAGIVIRPGPTNALTPRLEAVRLPLTRLIDGQPGLLLDPDHCPELRVGFNASYRYRKVRGSEDTYHEEPEKNEASHPHDACQYVLSGGGEHTAVHARHNERDRQVRAQTRVQDYDPYNSGAS